MTLSNSILAMVYFPCILVEHDGREEWFYSEKERLEYFAAHNLAVDVELEAPSNSVPDSAVMEIASVKNAAAVPTSLKPLCAGGRTARSQDAQ